MCIYIYKVVLQKCIVSIQDIASANDAVSLSPKNNANFRPKQSDLLPAPQHLPASEQPPLAATVQKKKKKKKKQPIANMRSFPSMHMLRHVSS